MKNTRLPNREDVYREFINWSGMFPFERKAAGLLDQTDFSKRYEVNKDTLTRWKQRPDFEPKVRKIRKELGFEKTSNVILAIYNSSLKGDPKSQKLWMEYFSGYNLNEIKEGNRKMTKLTINEVQNLADNLPQWRRKKYKDLLSDLLYDANFFIMRENMNVTEKEYNELHKDGL